ncbi:cation:dicarboxylate symporter family transporter [Ectopseudomonas composti]|uniref:cation:dicarboxylate symporter family transporter n=1 Tax=Ectopseudomonas composti TaxID=658457 RepID=UPI000773B4FC|nr:cation:dicarboxylase symporter family transporter [Pseudomonas composti]
MIHRLVRSGIARLLLAVLLGGTLGVWNPPLAIQMKPFSEVFLSVIGWLTPFVMFILLCSSVARLVGYPGSAKLAFRMLGYWQLVSLLSLSTGLVVALVLQPGSESYASPTPESATSTEVFAQLPALVLHSLEQSVILKVLLAALLCGYLLGLSGAAGAPLQKRLDQSVSLIFALMRGIVHFAPLAAFGAIAFTIGKYGATAALPLLKFLLTIYLASFLYVTLVLGLMLRLIGLRLWRLIPYIKEELLLVATTGSSVAALPRLLDKLETAGCHNQVARLVLTGGYSFNLNGSNLYLTVAMVFLAQLTGNDLNGQQLLLLLCASLFTSLGATSVAGSAFIMLTATLSVLQFAPLETLGILIGVERLMKCRSLTNVLGNCVACLFISRWNGALDSELSRQTLGRPPRRRALLLDGK